MRLITLAVTVLMFFTMMENNMKLLLTLILLVACSQTSATERDPKQRAAFVRDNPCPATVPHSKTTCPGYVVDHVRALACGGYDHPSNMQWQTVEEAKAKDKWERKGCQTIIREK